MTDARSKHEGLFVDVREDTHPLHVAVAFVSDPRKTPAQDAINVRSMIAHLMDLKRASPQCTRATKIGHSYFWVESARKIVFSSEREGCRT